VFEYCGNISFLSNLLQATLSKENTKLSFSLCTVFDLNLSLKRPEAKKKKLCSEQKLLSMYNWGKLNGSYSAGPLLKSFPQKLLANKFQS
jgi:hypothetical protein